MYVTIKTMVWIFTSTNKFKDKFIKWDDDDRLITNQNLVIFNEV